MIPARVVVERGERDTRFRGPTGWLRLADWFLANEAANDNSVAFLHYLEKRWGRSMAGVVGLEITRLRRQQ